ncbi:hypothetical protein FGAF344_25280 [Escherichia coli]|nr:hypothetical protein FGAF344_25280 [Escherichia coli]
MLGGADNPNGELLSYIIGADINALRKLSLKINRPFLFSATNSSPCLAGWIIPAPSWLRP